MGAWSAEVLNNDRALDRMADLAWDLEHGGDLYEITEGFLKDPDDTDTQLVGVAIVDASLNGADEEILGSFYDYEDFFRGLSRTPLKGLSDPARKALAEVRKDIDLWVERCRPKRQEVYDTLEKRLAAV